ncbi:unnamed protein product, partial [Lymnaea stagnalis]
MEMSMKAATASPTAPMLSLVVLRLTMMYVVMANTMADSKQFSEDQELELSLGATRNNVEAKRSDFLQAQTLPSDAMKQDSIRNDGFDSSDNDLKEPVSIEKRQEPRRYRVCDVYQRLLRLTHARDSNGDLVELV